MGKSNASLFDPPSSWLSRFAGMIPRGSSVLEIACGNGRNSLLLASRGASVTAVDINQMPTVPRGVTFIRHDLETGSWPFPKAAFDAVVVIRYLHRLRFADMIASVRPGGLFIYETFSEEQSRWMGKPANPDHVLRSGELLELCSGLRIIAFEDGMNTDGDFLSRIIARVPGTTPLSGNDVRIFAA